MAPAWAWFKYQNQGIVLDQYYRYTGRQGTCQRFPADNTQANVDQMGYLAQQNVEDLKNWVSQKAISVAIQAENESFYAYQSGIIVSDCGTNLDHGVTIVGYGKQGSTEYFIIKNSWGTPWGENGYGRIAPNMCGITHLPQTVILSNS